MCGTKRGSHRSDNVRRISEFRFSTRLDANQRILGYDLRDALRKSKEESGTSAIESKQISFVYKFYYL